MTIKALGSIETLKLSEISPEFGDLELKIKHLGGPIMRQAQTALQAARLAEIKRVKAMIAEHGEDILAEVYADHLTAAQKARDAQVAALEAKGEDVPEALQEPVTLRSVLESPEAAEELSKIARELIEKCAVSLGDLTDPKEIAAELDRYGIVVRAMNFALEVQRLTAAQFPASKDPGAGGPAAP